MGVAKLMKVDIAAYKGPAANKFNWLVAVVALIFIVFTISRSSDWKNNYSIFKAGVENAPKSSRTNEAYANELRKIAEKSPDITDRQVYLEESLKYSKHSLDILPTNKDALYNLGVVYTEMKDTANALAAYYSAIHYYPDFRSPLNNLGSIFLGKGQFDSAYKYMKLCYDTDTTFAKSSQNLAILYFKLGKYNEAIQFASNAIRLDENIVVPYDVLSQAYKAIGDPAKAASYQSLYRQKYTESVADQKPIVNE
jgi:tetratricopeptide (TPR) repeat protein